MGLGDIVKRVVRLSPVGNLILGPDAVGGNIDPEAKKIADNAAETAARAERELDEAKQRNTAASVSGGVSGRTAEDVTVAPAGNQAVADVKNAPATEAPTIEQGRDHVAAVAAPPRTDLGERITGSPDAAQAGGQTIQASEQGRGLQNEAALAFQRILRGDSAAQQQLKEGQAKAAAEQLSIAAGARGQGVAGARSRAAGAISGQQMEASGQAAKLRAEEIAQAAQGLLSAGSQVRAQDVDVAKTQAQMDQEVELRNANARDTAIQSAQERFARGELTEAQLETEVAKANADYTNRAREGNANRDLTLNIEQARQKLTADMASDERMQQAFNLEAELMQRAAAGDQQAQTQLATVQAQITAQIRQFNAKQIQDADASNIEFRLRAIGLDDAYIANARNAWLQAEQAGDMAALNRLRLQLDRDIKNQEISDAHMNQIRGDVTRIIQGVATGGASEIPRAAGAAKDTSDVRAKKDISGVSGEDVDGFLKAAENTSTWRYKEPDKPGRRPGPQIGPMAQDIATSDLARAAGAIGKSADGTMAMDFQKLAALSMAGLGRLNERLEAVEGKPRKPGPDVVGFLRAHGGR